MSSQNKTSAMIPNDSNLPRAWLASLLLLVIGLASLSVARIVVSVRSGSALDHVAGAWIALAMDCSDGVFYRPLFSTEMGFGGTRFFPLFFSVHALLIKLIGSPIFSGHIVSLLSGLLLCSGCYSMMRKTGTRPLMAIALVCLLSLTASIQIGLCTIRGDILPLALNVVGLAVFLSNNRTRSRILFASACFVLAFSAKITAVNGLLALLAYLFLNKRNNEAWSVLMYSTIGCVAVLSIMYLGSAGRVITIFTACAGGGANAYSVLKSPIELVQALADYDPLCLLLFFWASVAAVRHHKTLATSLPLVFLVASALISLFIYGSPGTAQNHLVDLATASIILIGSTEFVSRPAKLRASVCIYSILALFSLLYGLPSLRWLLDDENLVLAERLPKEILGVLEQHDGIVLSEDPMLPIATGRSPYMLDAFMLRLVLRNDDDLKSSTLEDINDAKFLAIIFAHDPLVRTEWYERTHFGSDFVRAVMRSYREVMRQGGYVVYCPK